MSADREDAVRVANVTMKSVGMPTYAEVLQALRDLEWAATGVDYMENEYGTQLTRARDVLNRAGGSK